MNWDKVNAIVGIVGVCSVVVTLIVAGLALSYQLQQIQRDIDRGTIHYVSLENKNDTIQHDFVLNESTWSSFTFYALVTLYYSDQSSAYLLNSSFVPHVTITSRATAFDFYNLTGRWAMLDPRGRYQVRFTLQVHYSQVPVLAFLFRCDQCRSSPNFLLANFNLSADALLI